MENMDNNLDDFFKKHLNSSDEPVEDWAKPDPGDWDKAAAQIPMFNSSPFWTISNLSIVGLSTVLVGALFYIWYLKVEVSTLEKNIQIQEENIERVQKDIKIIDEKYIKQQIIIDEENTILKQQNQSISQQNKQLKNITQQQQAISKIIETQTNDVSKVDEIENNQSNKNNKKIDGKENNNSNTQIPSKENKSDKNSYVKPQQPIAKQDDKIDIDESDLQAKDKASVNIQALETIALSELQVMKQQEFRLVKPDTIANRNHRKRLRDLSISLPKVSLKNIQLGYEFRAQTMSVPTSLDIQELETTGSEHGFSYNLIGFHGLTLDVPLNRKWSIQSGIRFSGTELEYKTCAEAIYNTENEFLLPDGSIANSFNIEQETPFATTNTDAQLVFDIDNLIENNEILDWCSYGFQSQRTVQIPLGISYRFDIKKLTGLVGVGVQWSKMHLGELGYEMFLYDRDKDRSIWTSATEVTSEAFNVHSTSAYTTLGLQYQFLENWSVRATTTYNFELSNNNTLTRWDNSNSALSLGLQYHF